MKKILKAQYGLPSTFLWDKETFDKVSKKASTGFNTAMGWVGDKITNAMAEHVARKSSYLGLSSDEYQKNKEKVKLGVEKAMPYISPSSHIAAWTQGSFDPNIGALYLASDPRLQTLGILGDIFTYAKSPKAIKNGVNKGVDAVKAGSKLLKKAVVTREMNHNIKQIKLPYQEYTPVTRTRIGDVEINDPQTFYRQGPTEMGNDFLATGIVNPGTEYVNPMFARGHLFYGLGDAMKTESTLPIKTTGRILLSKPRVDKPKPDLITTKTEMSPANLSSHPIKEIIEKDRTHPFSERDYKTYSGMEDFMNEYNDAYYNGEFPEFKQVKRVTHELVRTVPKELVTSSDATLYRYLQGYGYKKVLLEPSTSLKFFERPTLSNAQELAGATKWERNFTPQWHVANYPGYLLKGLMKGSLLEKQLSKNGTISINLLNAYFNKASQLEREIANKVLAEKFAGLKTIDYNLFKKAVLNELINYSTKPQMQYSTYGMGRLGFNVLKESDGVGGIMEYLPGVRTNTFTFESPRIPSGNSKHYDPTTLGHSRTYTTSEEPRVLHVMESQSDWALAKNSPEAVKTFNDLQKRIADLETKPNKTIYDKIDLESLKRLKKDLLNLNSGLIVDPQLLHLRNNYLQRLLQENLRYAAENGLTKMRYPTPETAAKIEGYSKTEQTPEFKEALAELERLQGLKTTNLMSRAERVLGIREAVENNRLTPIPDEINIETGEIKYYTPEEKAKLIHDAENRLADILIELRDFTYSPLHLTILKKYSDFPKLFLKLFKDLKVRTVTDTKGNTWYEVDVPKGYLSREWQFKQGGKINTIKYFKDGGLIRKMQTAAGGPIKRFNFSPEFIASIEQEASRVPGTDVNSNHTVGQAAREAGVRATAFKLRNDPLNSPKVQTLGELHTAVPSKTHQDPISKEIIVDEWEDKGGNSSGAMSGADPVGEFFVAGAALNPVFNLAGKGALYGMGMSGNNWARAKLISGTMDRMSPRNYVTNAVTREIPNPTKYDISDNVTLYRASPTSIKDLSYKGERYGDTSGLYVGKWFTDEPSKPNWYASNMTKRGEEPAYYLVTVPRYWAKKQKASYKISNSNIEYEPEDYIIEDGILGLQGQLYQGRPGTIQYLLLNFLTPIMKEPSTSLKFFERKPFNSKLKKSEEAGVPKGERNNRLHGQTLAPYYDYSLINKHYEPWTVNEKGQFVFGPPEEAGKLGTLHFTFNEPVMSHMMGSWDDAPTVTLLPYRNVRSLAAPVDMAIMDTFFPNYKGLNISSRGAKTLTGDKKTFDYYKSKGLDVEFSPEMEELLQQLQGVKAKLELLKNSGYSYFSPEMLELYKQQRTFKDKINSIGVEWSKKHVKPIPSYEKVNALGKAEGFDMEQYPYRLASPKKDAYGVPLEPSDTELNYTWQSDPSNHFMIGEHPEIILKSALNGEYGKVRPEFIKYLEWASKHKADYRKKGGKMNVLEFLKNGSGIHIKKKNRGKFTSYCGGKVTDACIRKAKASGNPTLVKRATFAANARKWRHKMGGILKASDGSNTKNWWSKATDWIGNNKDLLQTGFNAFSSIGNIGNTSKALNSFDNETQAGLNAINGNIDLYTNMYAPYFLNNNPDVQSSNIDLINKAFTYSKNIINLKKKEYLLNRTQAKLLYQNLYQLSMNNFSSLLSDFGLQAFLNFFPKANKTIDLKPVQGVSITPQESLKMNIPTLPSEFNFGNK